MAKPLCPKGNNGFRGERAGESNNSEKSQRSERTGLKEALGTMGGNEQRADKRKIKLLLLISIIVILIVLISLYYTFLIEEEEHVLIDDWDHLSLKRNEVEDGWLIEITAHKAWTDKNEDGFPLTDVYYSLSNNSWGYVDDINGIYDESETIIFNDNDSNNLLSNGDTFLISNNINQNDPTGVQFLIMVNGLADHVLLN